MFVSAGSPEIEVIVTLGRGVLALVLLLAAVTKVRDRGALRTVLVFLAPSARGKWAWTIAAAITGIEGSLAVLLAVGIMPRTILASVMGLLLAATVALGSLRRRGYEGGCACFGELTAGGPVGRADFARNGVLLAVAIGILLLITTKRVDTPPLWSYSAGEIAMGTTVAAGMLLCYMMIDAVATVRLAARPGLPSGGHPARDPT